MNEDGTAIEVRGARGESVPQAENVEAITGIGLEAEIGKTKGGVREGHTMNSNLIVIWLGA